MLTTGAVTMTLSMEIGRRKQGHVGGDLFVFLSIENFSLARNSTIWRSRGARNQLLNGGLMAKVTLEVFDR